MPQNLVRKAKPVIITKASLKSHSEPELGVAAFVFSTIAFRVSSVGNADVAGVFFPPFSPRWRTEFVGVDMIVGFKSGKGSISTIQLRRGNLA